MKKKMNYNDTTGLYVCPFCGAHSPIDYGVSCGCLYDGMTDTSHDPIRDVDWEDYGNFVAGFTDDSDVIRDIINTYNGVNNGNFISFSKADINYRLYI